LKFKHMNACSATASFDKNTIICTSFLILQTNTIEWKFRLTNLIYDLLLAIIMDIISAWGCT